MHAIFLAGVRTLDKQVIQRVFTHGWISIYRCIHEEYWDVILEIDRSVPIGLKRNSENIFMLS